MIEGDSLPVPLRRLVVDRLHLDEREIPLAIARRTHLPGDDITRAQVKAPDLRGGDVHVLGTGQIAVFGRAQESESLREAFEHPLDEEQAVALGLRAQDPDDQLLFAEMHRVHNPQLLRDSREPRQAQLPQFAHLQGHQSLSSPQDPSFAAQPEGEWAKARSIARHTSSRPSPVRAEYGMIVTSGKARAARSTERFTSLAESLSALVSTTMYGR